MPKHCAEQTNPTWPSLDQDTSTPAFVPESNATALEFHHPHPLAPTCPVKTVGSLFSMTPAVVNTPSRALPSHVTNQTVTKKQEVSSIGLDVALLADAHINQTPSGAPITLHTTVPLNVSSVTANCSGCVVCWAGAGTESVGETQVRRHKNLMCVRFSDTPSIFWMKLLQRQVSHDC